MVNLLKMMLKTFYRDDEQRICQQRLSNMHTGMPVEGDDTEGSMFHLQKYVGLDACYRPVDAWITKS